MPIHNLSQQPSLATVFLSELRDVDIQKDRLRFRRNVERLGEIMAYEISKQLTVAPKTVQTPLGTMVSALPQTQPVLATILRAGLPFHQGFLNFFDKADNAFLTAYRKHDADGSFKIALEYIASANFSNRPLIVCDPMIATGSSMCDTLNALLELAAPSSLYIACVIASEKGIELLQHAFPAAHIWAAAIDSHLDKNAYIVPGLGDAGDLAFGEKLQK